MSLDDSKQAMREFAKIVGDSIFFRDRDENGFHDFKKFGEVEYTNEKDGLKFKKLRGKPNLKPSFRAFLKKKEVERLSRFKSFVDDNPEEFGGAADQTKAKANPTKHLDCRYLFQKQTLECGFQ